MIRKVVSRRLLRDRSGLNEDREYWLSRPSGERIEAVEIMRREVHGDLPRLQRVARVIQLKDLADIERLEGSDTDNLSNESR